MTHPADHLHAGPRRTPMINPSFAPSARAAVAFSKKMEVNCELGPRNIMPLHRRAEEKIALEKAAIVFSSLSNAVRLGVLVRLIKREWSVNELASDLEIGQSALSQHLGKLRQAGIVRSRRNAQTMFYRCDNHTVIRLLAEAGLTQ